MRIKTFYRGRSMGSENGWQGLASAMAFISAHDYPDLLEEVGPAKAFYQVIEENFAEWLESIFSTHEFHITDIEGNRLFDQYVVIEDWNLGD